jgi:NDP-sugar pyrophosphorylase family protein
MKAGIIAAGLGERLIRGGIATPKPLVPVGGEPMLGRVIRAAAGLGVSAVACIVNDLDPAVADYVRSTPWSIPIELLVRTTPNSMESFLALEPMLSQEPFLLFTVDAIASQETLAGFVSRAVNRPQAAGVLAVTTFVDDEKPLWVALDQKARITALGSTACPTPFVTAGFYYFLPNVFEVRRLAHSRNLTALRQFLGLLLEQGYLLHGLPVSKTVDVDHPEDLEKAEAFLREIDE